MDKEAQIEDLEQTIKLEVGMADKVTWRGLAEALYATGYRKVEESPQNLYEMLTEDFVEPVVNFYIPDKANQQRVMELWRGFKKDLVGYHKLPMVDCPECKGEGFLWQPHEPPGAERLECPNCGGTGKLPERPKVLTRQQMQAILEPHYGPVYPITAVENILMQAQLEADIRHIWGKE